MARSSTTDIKNILENNYAQNFKINGKCMPEKKKKKDSHQEISKPRWFSCEFYKTFNEAITPAVYKVCHKKSLMKY